MRSLAEATTVLYAWVTLAVIVGFAAKTVPEAYRIAAMLVALAVGLFEFGLIYSSRAFDENPEQHA